MITRLASCVCASAVLAACSLVPAHVRPGLPTPETYAAEPAVPGSIAAIDWRLFFSDPELTGLIEAALANNRDIRIATARMAQARADLRIEGSRLYPCVDAPSDARGFSRAGRAGSGASVCPA